MKKIGDFLKLLKCYWYTSKMTMILKPLLYLITVIIATYKNDFPWLIIIGIICIIFDFLLNTFETNKFKETIDSQQEKIQNLGEIEQEIEIYGQVFENHLKSFLIFLSTELKLDRSERISVYYRDEKNEDFRIVSRYSSNPNYASIGRNSYKKGRGYISKCWEGDSNDFIRILPEYGTDEYLSEQDKVGYTRTEINNLSMKSRIFYVLNISKSSHPSIGVIVIESTKDYLKKYEQNKGDEQRIRNLISKDMSKYMSFLYDLMDKKMILKQGNDHEK